MNAAWAQYIAPQCRNRTTIPRRCFRVVGNPADAVHAPCVSHFVILLAARRVVMLYTVDPMQKLWYLSHLDLFEGISEEEVHRISERATDLQSTDRITLYTPFDGCDRNVFIVKEGEVVLYHSADGKRKIFDVLGPGMLFGNFVPNTETVSHYAEALPGTRICTFPPEDLQRVVTAHPEVLARLLGKLTERLHDYEARLQMDMASAQEKVLGELKRYSHKKRNLFSWFRDETPLALSHERIAELTGLNRVTVTRAIKILRHRDLIAMDDQGRIVLHH